MRSLAGLDLSHSSMAQVATESLQPQVHANRAPTRRTSILGFSDAVWASAATASSPISSNKLLSFFNGCMFFRIAHHFRAGVLHLDLARDQADKGAANQHQAADP